MASYKIQFKKSALKDLNKLEKHFVPQIYNKITSLSENPRSAQSTKLKGGENSYRLRIGNYRIIYQIDDSAKIVLIFGVGHRKEIYRDL
ncbi:type II toxin-antitoxin system RelE/ParE family toxin [Candidatus Saganbacteria bacterium]|nr:type II toxin-antitoxin system RelE/ParE family toxin [Candidatus Saganbacteria bacterium]